MPRLWIEVLVDRLTEFDHLWRPKYVCWWPLRCICSRYALLTYLARLQPNDLLFTSWRCCCSRLCWWVVAQATMFATHYARWIFPNFLNFWWSSVCSLILCWYRLVKIKKLNFLDCTRRCDWPWRHYICATWRSYWYSEVLTWWPVFGRLMASVMMSSPRYVTRCSWCVLPSFLVLDEQGQVFFRCQLLLKLINSWRLCWVPSGYLGQVVLLNHEDLLALFVNVYL